ncbi:MAG: hypothetical protein ACI9EW_002207 [Cellvibrionaceae bacterium]|jgi:hypothetical protein
MNHLKNSYSLILLILLFSILASCNTSEPTPPTIQVLIVTEEPSSTQIAPEAIVENQKPELDESTGYPAPRSAAELQAGYPAPESNSSAEVIIDSPELQFDTVDATKGSVGGILALEILDDGYIPLEPSRLLLGDVIFSNQGDPFFIRTNGSSQTAKVFSTGMFIFDNVPPGTYGLMVDLTFTAYPVLDENGNPVTFTIEANQVFELGELLAPIPTGS